MSPATGRSWTPDLPGTDDLAAWNLDRAWSRALDVPSHDGGSHRWHVLDSGPAIEAAGQTPVATMVCVHGNPTWAYSWATFLRTFGDRVRVIAVDQLGMGFSDRTELRRYATRVTDLGDVIGALDIDSDIPLFLAAHDWGGAIAMGWAVDHAEQIAGMVLCNTGIGVPAGRRSPALIRLAASPALRDFVCRRTKTFVAGTTRLSGSKISAADRAAFRAPYPTAAHRAAVSDFVGDVPLVPGGGHPSDAPLADVAKRLGAVQAPVLLAWGAADPVFNDDFAADLADRLPNTRIQRYPKANHLVMAEADVAATVDTWIADVLAGRLGPAGGGAGTSALDSPADIGADAGDVRRRPLWSELERRRVDTTEAFVDMASGNDISWANLAARVDHIAADLVARGLRPGDRVAMLTPPGVELAAAIYGVWRAGGVTVVADRGLGLTGLGRAVRSTRPSWVIGPKPALAASRTLRWAPRSTTIEIGDLMSAVAGTPPAVPAAAADAAILFTSGATGPAKGVRYRHSQLEAQRDALAATYAITPDDRLLAAFAPFALYGPALGIGTVLPDCDVTAPGSLTANACAAACERFGATVAFASPAALANVLKTAANPGSDDSSESDNASGSDDAFETLDGLRLVMSAGAPVPAEILVDFGKLAPNAELRTPYGMTEVLPVADIDLVAIESAIDDEPAGGVCVGHPVEGANVIILPLGFDAADPHPPLDAGETGEILVNAPWVSEGYVGLWAVERDARPDRGDGERWHRSGDVGHLDASGRLWVEGRAIHTIDTAAGVVTSVPVERVVERQLELARVAAVGVGPAGRQQLVVVIEDVPGTDGLATTDLTARVRSVVAEPVAAVLTLRSMPVDIRHNAKIDRGAVAAWASDLLAGQRAHAPGSSRLPWRR